MIKRTILTIVTTVGLLTTVSAQRQAEMTMWSDRPADFFEEAYPIGNGKMGAMIYGAPNDDVLFTPSQPRILLMRAEVAAVFLSPAFPSQPSATHSETSFFAKAFSVISSTSRKNLPQS